MRRPGYGYEFMFQKNVYFISDCNGITFLAIWIENHKKKKLTNL